MNTAGRVLLAFVFFLLMNASTRLPGQTTVGTGSIVGAVSDPSGAVIRGASVTISNVATGQFIGVTSNSSGSFNSGALIPGNYKTLFFPNLFAVVFKKNRGGFSRTIALSAPLATVFTHLEIGTSLALWEA
jgi:hypothetical protein